MAYINGNKPIVTNGLVYALDFSNPKNNQNSQVVQSLAFNPTLTYVSGNLATPSITNNGLNFNQISLGTYGAYFNGDLITAFLSSSIPAITRNGTFTIAWTALVQNTSQGLFLTQNNNDVILHTRISKTSTTLGFYDSGSNSLFEGKTYSVNYGTTPNHCVWVYSSGSSTVYVNGSPITASGTFIQSGVADNRVFGINGDPVRLNVPWSGILYNLQVYNRALSQNDIITNYQNAAIIFKIPVTATASTLDPNTVLYTQRASITDTNTISSINTFVTSLKSSNLWDKLTGIYPFTGLSTSSNAINLKEPGIFNLTYNGLWSGSTPSSSTSYITTNWHPQAISNGFSYPTINTSSLHLTYLSYDLPQTSSTLIGQLGTPLSASGGTITTSGNRTIHTFTTTGSNTFQVFTAGVAEVLVVAGGASGGARYAGGGAGGVVYSASVYLPSGSYVAFVGDGGPATTDAGFGSGSPGTGSYIYTVSASGGGAGGYFYNSSNQGGAGGSTGGNGGQLGLGSTPRDGINGQGSAGGVVIFTTPPTTAAPATVGGGGGALTNGTSQVYVGTYKSNGNGGSGIGYSISGVHTYYGGGGGGGSNLNGGGTGTTPNAGGRGGGGTGGNLATGSSGSANTGGGGGSGDYFTANNLIAKGGSGVIIISYETSATSSNAIQITENGVSASLYNTIQSSITSSGNIGLITVNRNTSGSLLIHKNNVSQSFSVPATSSIGVPFYINALNNNFSASSYSPSTISYASIGAGLTTSEVATYHNLVSQLQANLKRQNTLLDNYSGSAAAYSLRRIGPSGYFGPAIRVRRDSDNTLRDIGFTSDGQLDTVGLLDFVGVTGSGFVQTWYDQSGNGRDASQATAGSQPLVIRSGSILIQNTKPTVQFDGSNDGLNYNGNFFVNSKYSIFLPLARNSNKAFSMILGGSGTTSANLHIGFRSNTAFTLAQWDNDLNGTIAPFTSSRLELYSTFNAIAGKSILLNSTTLASNSNTADLTSYPNSQIGNTSTLGYYEGNVPEIIAYASDQTSNRTALETNINNYYKIYGSATASFDPDYSAFITATGITQPTQSAALETLVSDLKSYGLWSKMKAIYPMVTDKNNRFAYSQELNTEWNPVNTVVATNNVTAPDGTLTAERITETTSSITTYTVTNNGASAYTINGSDNPVLTLERGKTYQFNINASGHPFYIMTGSGAYTAGGQYDTGVTGQGTQVGTLTFVVPDAAPSTLAYVCQFHSSMGNTINVINNTDSHHIYQTIADGLVTGSEYVASIHARFLNRPWLAMETNTGAKAWFNIQTGITGSLTGSNATITAVSGGWYRCALYFTSSVASGPQNIQYHLADTNGNLTYAGVLGTGSYLWGAQFENGNLLGPYRATTTTGFTTGSMFDQMKFNLKNPADNDAAFRITYSGSWNPGYSGAKPDGTTAYADTKLIPSSSLTNNNTHISIYSRTDNLLNQIEIGSWPSSGNRLLMTLRYSSSGNFEAEQYKELTSRVSASNSNSTGLYISSRTNNTTHKSYKNNIQFGSTNSGDPGSTTNINASIWIGAVNTSIFRGYSTKEFGFSTIGDGLTDYEAKALYWIVQKYQTTLGRQVY
jgi:hypothetical protein